MANFGNVNVGNTSPVINATFTNSSVGPFGPIFTFGGEPPPFAGTQNCEGVTLALQCGRAPSPSRSPRPARPQAFQTVIGMGDSLNEADSEQFVVELRGVGVNPITVSPSSVDFGTVAVGTTSPETP